MYVIIDAGLIEERKYFSHLAKIWLSGILKFMIETPMDIENKIGSGSVRNWAEQKNRKRLLCYSMSVL